MKNIHDKFPKTREITKKPSFYLARASERVTLTLTYTCEIPRGTATTL